MSHRAIPSGPPMARSVSRMPCAAKRARSSVTRAVASVEPDPAPDPTPDSGSMVADSPIPSPPLSLNPTLNGPVSSGA